MDFGTQKNTAPRRRKVHAVNPFRPQWAWIPGMALLVAMVGGCQTNQLTKERDALFAQNSALQQRLNESRSAYDAVVAERDRLANQLAMRQTAPPPPPATGGTGGFGSIEGVESFTDRGQITVRIPGDVLFASGKITLKDSSQKTLQRVAAVIKSEHPTSTIRVLGYTDTDPIRKSKWVDNLQLSQERAAAVHRFLEKQGLKPKTIEAVGKGPWHPRNTKALSRRVEIVVVLAE